MAQKYFDQLPCFSHDIHATLSRNCKYILFNPNVSCLIIKLTNFMHFLLKCTVMFTIARRGSANYPKEKVFVKYTTLIDKCKNKRKIMWNYQCFWVKKIIKHKNCFWKTWIIHNCLIVQRSSINGQFGYLDASIWQWMGKTTAEHDDRL